MIALALSHVASSGSRELEGVLVGPGEVFLVAFVVALCRCLVNRVARVSRASHGPSECKRGAPAAKGHRPARPRCATPRPKTPAAGKPPRRGKTGTSTNRPSHSPTRVTRRTVDAWGALCRSCAAAGDPPGPDVARDRRASPGHS